MGGEVMLSYADIVVQIGELWEGSPPPTLSLDGSDCKLTTAAGQSVSFPLTRAQLKLPPDQFVAQILKPAIDKLKAL
jgi:hypothetical protein